MNEQKPPCCHGEHKHKAIESVILADSQGVIYICPMHPQVRQEGPGTCPVCGMALEPEMVTSEKAENHELSDMTRRFWFGLIVTPFKPFIFYSLRSKSRHISNGIILMALRRMG